MHALSSLPVVVPFVTAALLVSVGSFAPRWFEDGIGVVAASAVVACAAVIAGGATSSPFAYWLGGWRPYHGVAIGIGMAVDPLGAGLAAFAGLLVLASLIYSLRYFDAVHGIFHGLMLLFGAAMAGFCLTGDLFNLIVFFELMSTVAYALTAYRIEEKAPIQGAINFAITNSIAGYSMFIAAALLYARTGALNMAQIGSALNGHHPDPLVLVALALLVVGFLTKAAVVPLHFWLADAHAVAPAPVCVLFSGVMVELGVYAVARLYWVIFAGTLHAHVAAVHAVLITLGTVTALIGAWMCVLQRHIKRLLAFSTISHVGIFVCAVGLLSARALTGVALYIVGHGLTKGALFMGTGVLLHRFRSVDEFDLHGRGRVLRSLGVIFGVGGLLLAALPPFTAFLGKGMIEETGSHLGVWWITVLFVFVSAMTGGAVLRVTGRVFLAWGPADGPAGVPSRAGEERVDEERDSPDHTPPLMLLVPAVLLVLAAGIGLIPGCERWIARGAALFTDHQDYVRWVLHGAGPVRPAPPDTSTDALSWVTGFLAVFCALGVAAVGLFGRSLRDRLPEALRIAPLTVRSLHSGDIRDYLVWWTAGAATVGGAFLIAVR